jgi:hypothetical protein
VTANATKNKPSYEMVKMTNMGEKARKSTIRRWK